jgi:hypothetical protein
MIQTMGKKLARAGEKARINFSPCRSALDYLPGLGQIAGKQKGKLIYGNTSN